MVYQWVVNPSINLTISDIIGYTDFEIFPPDTARELYAIKKRVLESGEGFAGECSIQFGGKPYPTQLYIRPFRNERDEITGLIGAAIDVHNFIHQKRRETLNEQRYRRLFDAMHEEVCCFSPVHASGRTVCDFCITDLNRLQFIGLNGRKRI